MIVFCAWKRDSVYSLHGNLGFQKCVSVYTMPKTAARDIHGKYQYDASILVLWTCEQ